MKKLNAILNIIIILLMLWIIVDLLVFNINTMPILTRINHEDFIEQADKIEDLEFAKEELKKWINNKYEWVYKKDEQNIKYLYIMISLFVLYFIKVTIINKRR